jgi:phage baseplate assembly protein gpV
MAEKRHGHSGFARYRRGIVVAQDTVVPGRVRVQFADLDGMTSYWLQVVMTRELISGDRAWDMPDIGSQVACILDENFEDGCVMGCLTSQADPAPVTSADKVHRTFKDGTTMEYDRAAHVLTLSFNDGAIIKYDAGAHVLTLQSTGTATLTAPNGITIEATGGDIALQTDEFATTLNTILNTYNEHTHSGIMSGDSNTAIPNQEIS